MFKIILLTNDVHLDGGGEKVLSILANYLINNDYLIEIVSLNEKKSNLNFSFNEKIEIKYLNSKKKYNKYNKYLKNYFYLNLFIKKIKKKTIFISFGFYPNILLSFISNQNLIKIAYEHNSFNSINNILSLLRKFCYKKFDRIICLTNYDYFKLTTLNKNVTLIKNPFLLKTNSITPKTYNDLKGFILTVTRFSYEKGIDLLLEIILNVSKLNSKIRFVIVGNGPLKDDFVKLIKFYNLEQSVFIFNFTENIDFFYKNASFYLMTSRSEGLPLSLIEAITFGLPAISFDCDSGPREIIVNNYNGYLIKCFDINIMVSQIIELNRNSKLRFTFSENSKKRSKMFDINLFYKNWLSVINSYT